MKICGKCKVEKGLNFFGKSSNSKDGHRWDCKECRSKYALENKEKLSKYKHEYYLKNKEKCDKINKKWYLDNIEKKKEYDKEYSDINKENRKKSNKKWREENGDKRREYKRNYYKLVTTKDNLKRLKHTIRSSIRSSFILEKKSVKTIQILGCSFEEFKSYIESKFESWMTWENRGLYNGELKYGWDIDHIIPISSAKTKEEVIELNHYTNLQPLCSCINRDIKRNSMV